MKDCLSRIFDCKVLKLIDCVFKSDYKSIDCLLQHGFEKILDYQDPFEGKTALITSVITGNHEMTEYLIKLGSDPNSADFRKRTPLMFACMIGDFKMVEVLCLKKSDVNLIDSDLKTALIHCFVSNSDNHMKCLETLLKYGADCNQNIAGKTPFLIACERSKEVENLSICLISKADLSIFDKTNGNSALHYSAINGCTDLCYFLLKNGSNPDFLNFSNQTPSHFAAEGKFVDLLKILWSFGANFDLKDRNGDNVMNFVFKKFDLINKKKNFKVAKYLCSRGAQPFHKNSTSSFFPLNIKFDKLKIKIFNMTKKEYENFSSFYSINIQDLKLTDENFRYWMLRYHDTFTIVFKSIEKIYDDIYGEDKVLDKEKFSFFVKSINSTIPHLIIDKYFDLICNNLIVDKNKFFDIRIYKALSFGKFSLDKGLKLKPKKYSNIRLKTEKEKNKLQICIPIQKINYKALHYQSRFSGIFDLLRPSEVDHVWSNDARWYLIPDKKTKIEFNNLVNRGEIEELEKILSKKSAQEAHDLVNSKDLFYKTPLMIAVMKENEKIIDLLSKYNMDINLTDNFKWTALHHSIVTGNLNIVKQLVNKNARIKMKNIAGRTALDLAVIYNQKLIEKYLKNIM